LTELAADEERYERLLQWRTQPLDAQFLANVREQRLPAMCRLCRLLGARRQIRESLIRRASA
jgi:hypothetical protein